MNDGPQDPTPDMPAEPGPSEPGPSEPAPLEPAPVDAPTKKGPRIALVVGIVVVVLAAAIGAGAFLLLRGAPESVLDKVPASADVVFVAHLDPAASQKMNLFRMAEKFPALGSEEGSAAAERRLDSVLADAGMTRGTSAWVGGGAGGYVDVGSAPCSRSWCHRRQAAASDAMQRMRDASRRTTTTIDGIEWRCQTRPTSRPRQCRWGRCDRQRRVAIRSVIAAAREADSIESDPVFRACRIGCEDNLGFVFVSVRQLLDLANLVPGAVEVCREASNSWRPPGDSDSRSPRAR
jgi:hypothetical protein